MKVFLGSKGDTWARTIEKSKKDFQVWSHEGSTFLKIMTQFGQNSCPGDSDPSVFQLLAKENQHLLAQKAASPPFAQDLEIVEVHSKKHHQGTCVPFQERAEVMRFACVHFQCELSILHNVTMVALGLDN